jgi:hypothetical protein
MARIKYVRAPMVPQGDVRLYVNGELAKIEKSFTTLFDSGITVGNTAGLDAIAIPYQQSPGAGYAIDITSASTADVRGIFVNNSTSGAIAGTYGIIIGNDTTRTFIMGKTSSGWSGSKFVGSPAGELSWFQSGGNIPISFAVGTTPTEQLGISTTAVNTPNMYQVAGIPPLASIVADVGPVTTVETYLTSGLAIPAAALKVGNAFKITILGNATSSAANTVTFNARLGAAGTVADAAIHSFPLLAATSGTGNGFKIEFYITVRAVGAGGSLVSMATLLNGQLAGIANINSIVGFSGVVAVNTTGALILGCSGVTTAGTTSFTIREALVERLF